MTTQETCSQNAFTAHFYDRLRPCSRDIFSRHVHKTFSRSTFTKPFHGPCSRISYTPRFQQQKSHHVFTTHFCGTCSRYTLATHFHETFLRSLFKKHSRCRCRWCCLRFVWNTMKHHVHASRPSCKHDPLGPLNVRALTFLWLVLACVFACRLTCSLARLIVCRPACVLACLRAC